MQPGEAPQPDAALQQAGRPNYFDDPEKDQLLALVLELAEEVCVQRDRLATSELLAAAGQAVTKEAIDAFEPDADETARRLQRHRAWYTELFERLA